MPRHPVEDPNTGSIWFVDPGAVEGRSNNELLTAITKGYLNKEDNIRQFPDATPESAFDLAKLKLNADVRVRPASKLEKLLMGRAQAGASPITGVVYNPELMPYAQEDIDDLLAHEVTHMKQFNRPFAYPKMILEMLLPYRSRPHEKEAYDVAEKRRQYRRDINLPKDK